jgi:heme-degrading monooxygenase HmoA
MIVRAWRGRASPTNPSGYAEHFRKSVAPQLRAIAGFRGASLLKEERPGEIEFLVLTRWDSMDAIRAFAGDDVGRAVVEPGAVAALVGYDERVSHYELVDEVQPIPRRAGQA